jgi:carbamoyltransferase
MVKILGIKYGGHDTSASLLIDGKIIAACAQERYSKDKHSRQFPIDAINDCLKIGKTKISKIDEIAFVGDINLYFREMYLNHALKSKTRMKFLIKDISKIEKILNIENFLRQKLNFKKNINFYPHHLCHIASSYYASGFNKSICLSLDGVGEYQTDMVAIGFNNTIKIVEKSNVYPNSLGLLYSAITYFLGWKHHCDEGIIMGLAPYGNYKAQVPGTNKSYLELFQEILIKENSQNFKINLEYVDYYNQRDKWVTKKFINVFGKKRKYNDKILQSHKDIASALQKVLENFVLGKLKFLKKKYKIENLCLAGGVALNCSMNGKIESKKIFKNIFIQPASGDDGCSIGACYLAYKQHSKKKIKKNHSSYLGSRDNQNEIIKAIRNSKVKFIKSKNIYKDVAKHLKNGEIISWYQGEAEFGPRALGNRSILCKPFPAEMKDYLNKRVKFREEFRPFAPAVLDKFQKKYFSLGQESLHMLIACKALKKYKKLIPAVVHVDNTCRVQTVKKEINLKFYKLINEFYKITNIPVVLNTSFNVKGQPIVNTPEDAIRTFLSTNIDVLAIGDYISFK